MQAGLHQWSECRSRHESNRTSRRATGGSPGHERPSKEARSRVGPQHRTRLLELPEVHSYTNGSGASSASRLPNRKLAWPGSCCQLKNTHTQRDKQRRSAAALLRPWGWTWAGVGNRRAGRAEGDARGVSGRSNHEEAMWVCALAAARPQPQRCSRASRRHLRPATRRRTHRAFAASRWSTYAAMRRVRPRPTGSALRPPAPGAGGRVRGVRWAQAPLGTRGSGRALFKFFFHHWR
jgi:hypothetical protein